MGQMLGDMDDTIVELASSFLGGMGGGMMGGGGGGPSFDFGSGGSGIQGTQFRSPGIGVPANFGSGFGGYA